MNMTAGPEDGQDCVLALRDRANLQKLLRTEIAQNEQSLSNAVNTSTPTSRVEERTIVITSG